MVERVREMLVSLVNHSLTPRIPLECVSVIVMSCHYELYLRIVKTVLPSYSR